MNEFSDELTNLIMPEYVRKMGMSIAPFSDLDNEIFYYQNDNKTDLLKKIAHLLEYTNLVLFLQGAKGVGKTSIIKQRLLNKKDNWKTCCLSAKDYPTSDGFVAKIAADFNLHLSTNFIGSPAASLQEQLTSLRHTGLLPILIIDDIELLKDNLIPMLMSFIYTQDDERPRLRLIISGEDISDVLLNSLSNKDEKENIKYLPALPLTQSETSEYIKFRMEIAGFKQKTPFSPDVIKKIYLDAKGFPKLINQLANHYLSQYAQGKILKQPLININENNFRLKFAAGVLVIIVTGFIFSLFFSDDRNSQKNRETETLIIPNTLIENQKKAIDQKTITKLTTDSIAHNPKKNSEEKMIANAKTSVVQTAKAQTSTNNSALNAWVLSQNENFYTLQLIGSSKKISAQNFIDRHNLSKDAHIFSTTRKGKPWYSVIYKSYPTHSQAKTARASLPKVLKQSQPWIRKFSQIVKELK